MLGPVSSSGNRNKDKIAIVVTLVTLVCVSWIYLVYVSNGISDMEMSSSMKNNMGMGAMKPGVPMPWGVGDWISMLIMWSVMMIGMMIPSASPMIILFARLKTQKSAQVKSYIPTLVFVSGYVVIWSGFSILATIANYILHSNAMMSGMMGETTSSIVGGVLLVAAGIFQFTPIKKACLNKCRTPMGFLMTNWKDGNSGALRMGLEHGTYCLGCCWLLMALLFVLGVMNLVWIAALALFVLIEKMAPNAQWIGWISGVALIIWGGLLFLI